MIAPPALASANSMSGPHWAFNAPTPADTSDEDEAPVEKERTRNIGKKSRRRRPLDDAAPAHSTVRCLDAGGLPPVDR